MYNKLDVLCASFYQRIANLKQDLMSDYLLAQEAAKHEIFFHIVKQFIIRDSILPAGDLIRTIISLNEDFLLDIIGLLHLSVYMLFYYYVHIKVLVFCFII